MEKVSIIIPCKEMNSDVVRCLAHCACLPEAPEIMVVSDIKCPGYPSEKRNWAMQRAKGDVFAFIDADAYPDKSWLTNALYWLQCHKAVCGPGVLPPDASLKERVADQVHRWIFCPYRVTPMKPRVVPWHPSFNLIMRREAATKYENYLTGEDERFCLNIKEGIFYHPDIVVYHNRRGIFRPLWKQFATYALHKGHFKRLAFIAWATTLFVYALNFIKGFAKRNL